ncbi:MAG: hypothetical protein GY798_27460 [Hyphomicrobiales bacterium]|nr:hypothetical protein [Hyphomicrobiales bacterium]
MFYKEILSAIAIALTIIAFVPYIRSIMRGIVRPHVFSWIIWSSVTFIVFLAQLSDRGGVGAWPIGVSGLITIYVAFLAYRKKSDDSITRLDWIFFVLAMTSIPLWYVTSDPLWAVVVLTTVDLIGFGPTLRKAYVRPFEEQVLFFVLIGVRNALSIIALENYSLTTILFPAATAAACVVFIAMVIARRRTLA